MTIFLVNNTHYMTTTTTVCNIRLWQYVGQYQMFVVTFKIHMLKHLSFCSQNHGKLKHVVIEDQKILPNQWMVIVVNDVISRTLNIKTMLAFQSNLFQFLFLFFNYLSDSRMLMWVEVLFVGQIKDIFFKLILFNSYLLKQSSPLNCRFIDWIRSFPFREKSLQQKDFSSFVISNSKNVKQIVVGFRSSKACEMPS